MSDINTTLPHIGIVIAGHVDAGKCFQINTPIMMSDGTIKRVQDIGIGDTVMGDDSQERNVLSIHQVNSLGYQISYNNCKNEKYIINDKHILSLFLTNVEIKLWDDNRKRWRFRWVENNKICEKTFPIKHNDRENYVKNVKYYDSKEDAKIAMDEIIIEVQSRKSYQKYGDIVDIGIDEYLKLSRNMQSSLKGYRVGLDFNKQFVDIDPYLIGLWLGDGHSGDCVITNIDQEVIDFMEVESNNLGLRLVTKGKDSYRFSGNGKKNNNIFLNFLKDNHILNNKHIPNAYKFNSRQNRLKLLAGLLDSDGYYSQSKNYYEITQKSEALSNDIQYLCRSLGFNCTKNIVAKTCHFSDGRKVTNDYYQMNISGSRLYEIPCLITRKQATEKNTSKNHSCYGLNIIPVEKQTFYGFEVDGNHRHLLGDFTVTHNSTTTGHLIFELGGISAREMEKLREEAKIMNRESFAFAFFMDRNKDERARGVTISCTTKEFFTPNYHYTIIDAPGHKDFIKNMISGASQADVALLLVPAAGFEQTIAKMDRKRGIMEGQTRQHARLLNLLGVDQIIVGVNKMDEPTVNYSEERYNEIRDEMRHMLARAGYKKKLAEIPIIPMSGFQGENLTKISDKMPWYKGFEITKKGQKIKGHTVVDALNLVVKPPKRKPNKPFRMPVSGVFKIKGVGDVITGRIEQGTIKPNDLVRFSPSGATGKAFTIEMHHKVVDSAQHGDNVGINVKNLNKTNMPHAGDVMTIVSDNTPFEVLSFKALVQVQDHPGRLRSADNKGHSGFTPSVHIRTAKAPCRLDKIHWKLGKSTGKHKQEDPLFLEKNDTAEVTFIPKLPFFATTFEDCAGLGRVAVMDSNNLIMLGKITQVIYKDMK